MADIQCPRNPSFGTGKYQPQWVDSFLRKSEHWPHLRVEIREGECQPQLILTIDDCLIVRIPLRQHGLLIGPLAPFPPALSHSLIGPHLGVLQV